MSSMASKGIAVLGATGTIGLNTLDVIRRNSERYHVVALTANTQVDRLFDLCCQFHPRYAVMVNPDAAEQLEIKLHQEGLEIAVRSGASALDEVVSVAEVDYVMAAIVGAAGLNSSLAAARAGKRILLANKESLVMAGQLFMDEVQKHNAELLPIDSEHNAIFQCMPADYQRGLDQIGVKKILLTGSGGPFREWPVEQLANVTPEQAVAHPNWNMGRKISVDSATMMNKGLELIEACWLFDTDLQHIEVVLHPQSIIHSMVEYLDGSILAQLGQPDMRTPIAHALAWPERICSGVDSLDLLSMARLEFCEPQLDRYPCLELAREALRAGGTASCVLNAANEVAVQNFLDGKLNFTGIAKTVEYTLENMTLRAADSIAQLLEEDEQARYISQQYISSKLKAAGVM